MADAQPEPQASTKGAPGTISYFPLSYRSSFQQWWTGSTKSAERAEQTVLSFLPFYPEPDQTRRSTLGQVQLSGKNRSMNEFAVQQIEQDAGQGSTKRDMVMLHGYGSGIGLYYRVLDPLTRGNGRFWNLFCLDWLGMGRSSRPSFKIKSKDRDGKIDETEDFFVDALEEWRKLRNIEKFVLMGHSLGGYLGVAYARKFPERISKLILVSPVGVPSDPYATHSEPKPLKEIPEEDRSDERTAVNASSNPENQPRRRMPKWAVWFWDQNISPFQLIRAFGPFGPKIASAWTSRRFGALSQDEQLAMHDYAYSTFRLRGSGEYALGYLLAPGAYARRPLIHRVGALQCPTIFVYGSQDWMDPGAGRKASEIIRKNGFRSSVHIVPNAGHNVFLDNPAGFDKVIQEEMK